MLPQTCAGDLGAPWIRNRSPSAADLLVGIALTQDCKPSGAKGGAAFLIVAAFRKWIDGAYKFILGDNYSSNYYNDGFILARKEHFPKGFDKECPASSATMGYACPTEGCCDWS